LEDLRERELLEIFTAVERERERGGSGDWFSIEQYHGGII